MVFTPSVQQQPIQDKTIDPSRSEPSSSPCQCLMKMKSISTFHFHDCNYKKKVNGSGTLTWPLHGEISLMVMVFLLLGNAVTLTSVGVFALQPFFLLSPLKICYAD